MTVSSQNNILRALYGLPCLQLLKEHDIFSDIEESFDNLHILKLSRAPLSSLVEGNVLTGCSSFLGVRGVNETKLDDGVWRIATLSKGVAGGVSNSSGDLNNLTGIDISSRLLDNDVAIINICIYCS